MEIHQFRVVVRARSFERSCAFYGELLALPRLTSRESEAGRSATFQAGTGVVEVLGRTRAEESRHRDPLYDHDGPDHKLTLTLVVPSAEKAYEQLQFRDRNVPGGLLGRADGSVAFETRDPDGVEVLFVEPVAG